MAFAELTGFDTLDATLGQLPEKVVRALAFKATALAQEIVDCARNDKLGGVLNVRSGALAASIDAFVTSSDDEVVATIGSFGDVKYAAIQEYGGKTAAHEIMASQAKALTFLEGGTERFARVVHHPGSQIPARSYLRSSLDEMTQDVVDALGSTPGEVWSDA